MSELKIYTPIPANTLFDECQPEPKLRCTVEWNTLIREAPRKGKENRTAKLSEPRFSIDGADFILTDEDYDNFAQAFIDKDGKVTGFPFKFPLDYYTTASPEYYDTTIYQQGVLVQLTTTTYQACKKYCVNGISSYKTLNNLVNGTIQVYKDGVLQSSGITVNLTTGVFTFSVAPSGVLTLACEHRPNFRFDVDDLQLTQIKKAVADYGGNQDVFRAINFRLVEDNYTKLSPLELVDWNSDINYDLASYATNTTYSDSVKSFIESGDNKREIRESFDVVRKLIKLESSNASWKRNQLYYTLFNVAKGRLLSFDFDTTQVRFDQDIFTSEQLGINAWTFDGLSMIQTLFPSSEEVKNYTHCIKIERGLIYSLTESSSFNFNLGYPADGDYPRTIYAPTEVTDFVASNGGTIQAYLLSATCDNGFKALETGIEVWGVGVVTGLPQTGLYFGTGAEIDVLIYQRASGPCYFFGVVRWEVWG